MSLSILPVNISARSDQYRQGTQSSIGAFRASAGIVNLTDATRTTTGLRPRDQWRGASWRSRNAVTQ